MQNKRNYFGLGGEIGAGKSVLAMLLKENGACIISADETVHELYAPGERCYQRIVNAFGEKILDADGNIDRKVFAEIIFGNEYNRNKCNRIVHPYVFRRMFKKAKAYMDNKSDSVIVFEVPLLVESAFYKKMNKNIVVMADYNVRLKRIMDRNNLSEEQAKLKMDSQIPGNLQMKVADYVIQNNGSIEDLREQSKTLYQSLRDDIK